MRNDIRQGGIWETLKREYRELRKFMFTEDRNLRLASIGAIKRIFYIGWWLLKSLFLKLTPTRRLLAFTGILFTCIHVRSGTSEVNFQVLGGFMILFILMLELKDKLLAKEELEAGRAVQQALMPQRIQQFPGWSAWLFNRSANEVGGHLVDIFDLGNTRFGFARGDAAGKGLRAALLSAKLEATLRAIAPDFTSLSEMGEKLHHVFYRDSLPTLFASLVYIECQANGDEICMINAGHLPPLIIRNSILEIAGKGGVAMGLIAHTTYEEHRWTF